MIRAKPLTVYLLTGTLIWSALGCDSKKGSDGSGSTQSALRNPLLLQFLKLEPAVESQTPPAFKRQSTTFNFSKALSRIGLFNSPTCGDDINDVYGRNDLSDDQKRACTAALEARDRFFRQSPTEIRYWLNQIDQRLSSYASPSTYLPCMDPNNTNGGIFGVISYPAYSLVTLTPRQTFPDGFTFNLIPDFKVSCRDVMLDDSGSPIGWRGIGRENGTTYIAEASSRDPLGLMAKIDPNGDIDLWLTFRGTRSDFNPEATTQEEIVAWADGVTNPSEHTTYPMSTGLVRMKAAASTGQIEMTLTGVGLGDGCGTRLITDGSYVFYQANRNQYGSCFAEDSAQRILPDLTSTEEVNAGGSQFDSNKADERYCLKADGDELIPEPNLSSCTARNLAPGPVVAAEGDETQTGELTIDDIFSLNMLTRSQIKAYNAPMIFLVNTDAVPTLNRLEMLIPLVNEEELASMIRTDHYFAQTSHGANRASGWCRDQVQMGEGQVNAPKTVNSVFTLNTLSEGEREVFNNNRIRQVVVELNNGYTERQSATKAFWADYNVTLTVKRNGATLAVQSNIPAPDEVVNRGANQSVTLTLPEGESLSAGDTLTLEMTGSNRYKCAELTTGAGLSGLAAAASVTMSRPHIRIYSNP